MSLSIPAGFPSLPSPFSTFTLFTINPYLALHVSSLSYSPFPPASSLHLSNSLFNLNNFKKSLPAPLPSQTPQVSDFRRTSFRFLVLSPRRTCLVDCTASSSLRGFIPPPQILLCLVPRHPPFTPSRVSHFHTFYSLILI